MSTSGKPIRRARNKRRAPPVAAKPAGEPNRKKPGAAAPKDAPGGQRPGDAEARPRQTTARTHGWSASLPRAALGTALESVYLSRYVLTQQGWRPAHETRDGATAMARGGLGAEGARPGPRQRNPWRALVEEVMGLHEAYTEREGEFARDRNPIHHRIGGYQFYYLPRNLVRVVHVLDGLPWSAVNPEVRVRDWLGGDPFRVLDLGCGSGAFSMAWLAWIAGSGVAAAALPPVEIVLVDQSRALLGLAQANLEAFARLALPGLRMTIEGHADGMASFLDRSTGERGPFGLVGAAMALNELGLSGSDRRSRSPRTVSRVAARVAPGGVLLLVEPGTHEGYLNAMAVREPMRAETPAWPVLYPCPHGAPCPMMDGPGRRWCHATISLPEPFFFDEALRQKGHLPLRMRELNLSALALQNTASGRAAAPFVARSGNRVVSNPMAGRGAAARTQVVLLCAEDGRLRERPAEELGATGRGDWVPAIRRS